METLKSGQKVFGRRSVDTKATTEVNLWLQPSILLRSHRHFVVIWRTLNASRSVMACPPPPRGSSHPPETTPVKPSPEWVEGKVGRARATACSRPVINRRQNGKARWAAEWREEEWKNPERCDPPLHFFLYFLRLSTCSEAVGSSSIGQTLKRSSVSSKSSTQSWFHFSPVLFPHSRGKGKKKGHHTVKCFSFFSAVGLFTATHQGNPPHHTTLPIQFVSQFWFVSPLLHFDTALRFACACAGPLLAKRPSARERGTFVEISSQTASPARTQWAAEPRN